MVQDFWIPSTGHCLFFLFLVNRFLGKAMLRFCWCSRLLDFPYIFRIVSWCIFLAFGVVFGLSRSLEPSSYSQSSNLPITCWFQRLMSWSLGQVLNSVVYSLRKIILASLLFFRGAILNFLEASHSSSSNSCSISCDTSSKLNFLIFTFMIFSSAYS